MKDHDLLPDDPAMDAELHRGDLITLTDERQGHLIRIGSSQTPYDYIIQTSEGSELEIREEDIGAVEPGEGPEETAEDPENPYEGLDGYHNAIGGASCPNCHDVGCWQCSSTYMYD